LRNLRARLLLGTVLLAIREARGREVVGARPSAAVCACRRGIVSSASDLSDRWRGVDPRGVADCGAGARRRRCSSGTRVAILAGYDGRPAIDWPAAVAPGVIGPFLRNAAARTLPDFVGMRYGSFARLLAAIVVVFCSLMFSAALLEAGAAIISRMLAVDADIAISVLAAVLLLCTLPGGMAGLTSSQVAQYAVLLIGSLAVFLLFAARPYDATAGAPYDALARAVETVLQGLGLAPHAAPQHSVSSGTLENLEVTLCLMTGTAALPHVIMPALSTGSMGQARASAAWTLVFIAILAVTLPTYMTLASTGADREQTGLMSGLLAAVSLAAMLAGASASALALANSLEHDLCGRLTRQSQTPQRPLIRVRSLLVIAVLAAWALASFGPTYAAFEPAPLLAWTFSLAAASCSGPGADLWTRTTTAGAIAGITSGFGISFYLLHRYFPQAVQSACTLTDPANGLPLVDAAGPLPSAWVAMPRRWSRDRPGALRWRGKLLAVAVVAIVLGIAALALAP
jgi:Na+(H+)/acetate symporter ActP